MVSKFLKILSNFHLIYDLKYDFSFENPQDCLDFLAKLEKIEQPEIKISWPQGQKRQIKGELSAANLSLKLLKCL